MEIGYWIPILIIGLIIATTGLVLIVILSAIHIYQNIPFRYVKLSNDSVAFIDELQQDIYEYFDEEAERE
jgi:hypothetical protein